MKRLTTTPFGQRAISACQIKLAHQADQDVGIPQSNKYELLRLLGEGRRAFGVSDRDLSVLAGLLSFSKGAELTSDMNLIVFPSNKTLSARIHGMPESTLRRHLAALVKAGLIIRHDSPNGKRYATRRPGGALGRAFGFDLRPLLVRAREIALAAEAVRIEAEELRREREEVVLMLRDAAKLVEYARLERMVENWDALDDQIKLAKRATRRKLSFTDMRQLKADVQTLLDGIRQVVGAFDTAETSGNDIQNERHQYNTIKEPNELRRAEKDQEISLGLVLEACPEIQTYCESEVRHWHELIALSGLVRSMLGIETALWDRAGDVMGRECAAIVIAGMLERIEKIDSPGAYLRVLAEKAGEGRFHPKAMVDALLNSAEKTAA